MLHENFHLFLRPTQPTGARFRVKSNRRRFNPSPILIPDGKRNSGLILPPSRNLEDFQPGDLVTCTVPPNLPHIMIISDKKDEAGHPLVIHNIGRGAREEDRLFEFKMTGRYRIKIE